jgi:hypothetical protein
MLALGINRQRNAYDLPPMVCLLLRAMFGIIVFCTFTQIIMQDTALEATQRLNVDLPKSQYFALKSYALHHETTVSQLVRDSLRSIVEYDSWFKEKVRAAQADPRPALSPNEWDAIRAKKLAQRDALAAKA